ncbi:SDR family oxidoreductase [Allofrancisella guangzhouensis]|uniref:Short-chain dehydrogenase n=1 Tax=Allofrancisella guangzhouensis TaxID=594679 RepID=A0A0A8EAK5_9GAMM|nr:SDR family oxidoreductase [Allofrancisella guangzhouensis]AJC49201.1 short-chain dehydrogenase [Allofrancisella guangzhouensis]MBK2027322.1 SDR family oxidoreductase [Allofrancisella guangzhouensis]MBK2043720.1 SDR family oxidoreductase [Allofrancisella guangzhouensis]MBK2045312.1 SDR family oxidoreductase [Allofrancisella guangzhouensis]
MNQSKENIQKEQPGLTSDMNIKPIHIYKGYSPANKLNGKVALITGGDSGIGKAVALHFVKEGAKVAFTYHTREKEDAKETLEELREVVNDKDDILAFEIDIKDSSQCNEFVEKSYKHFGSIDVLVNNAAVQFPQNDFLDISEEQLKETFETNFYHYVYMIKAVLKYMQKGASIINTTSVTAYKGRPDLIDYSSTKGAIVALTRSLAKNIIKNGIRVNAVAPGPVWTPLIPSSFDKEKVEHFGESTLLGRPAHPADIAPSYVFLANEIESKYFIGQVLHPNGGEIVNG